MNLKNWFYTFYELILWSIKIYFGFNWNASTSMMKHPYFWSNMSKCRSYMHKASSYINVHIKCCALIPLRCLPSQLFLWIWIKTQSRQFYWVLSLFLWLLPNTDVYSIVYLHSLFVQFYICQPMCKWFMV